MYNKNISVNSSFRLKGKVSSQGDRKHLHKCFVTFWDICIRYIFPCWIRLLVFFSFCSKETITLFIENILFPLENHTRRVMKSPAQEPSKHFPWLIGDWLLWGCLPMVAHHDGVFLTTTLLSQHEKECFDQHQIGLLTGIESRTILFVFYSW